MRAGLKDNGLVYSPTKGVKNMSLEKIDALEQRISKIIELVKELKEEKNMLEEEVARLGSVLDEKKAVEEEAALLRKERDQVRERLENIIQGIEGLTA
jgi:predicted nuclease with TOPRIM domain